MLEMERADKERNKVLLVKHTYVHNTRSFSKTHHLMLAMEIADNCKERNRLLLVKHTHKYTTQDNSTHLLMLAMERANNKRNRLLLVKHTQKTQHKTIQ